MYVANYLGALHESERNLVSAFHDVARHHALEPDIVSMCHQLASWSQGHMERLKPIEERYHSRRSESEPDMVKHALFQGPRKGGVGMVRDLHDLYLLGTEVKLAYTIVLQSAQALRDKPLEEACHTFCDDTKCQLSWIMTRIKQAAPQALVVG